MTVLHIGFTGTRRGMTESQAATFDALLKDRAKGVPSFVIFHHGDCVGSDEDAHRLSAHHPAVKRVVHPPINYKTRAFVHNKTGWLRDFDELLPEKDYKDRNKDIVDASDLMIATPSGFVEILRSGTWHAVRYARKKFRPLIIIWPDGETTEERLHVNDPR